MRPSRPCSAIRSTSDRWAVESPHRYLKAGRWPRRRRQSAPGATRLRSPTAALNGFREVEDALASVAQLDAQRSLLSSELSLMRLTGQRRRLASSKRIAAAGSSLGGRKLLRSPIGCVRATDRRPYRRIVHPRRDEHGCKRNRDPSVHQRQILRCGVSASPKADQDELLDSINFS